MSQQGHPIEAIFLFVNYYWRAGASQPSGANRAFFPLYIIYDLVRENQAFGRKNFFQVFELYV